MKDNPEDLNTYAIELTAQGSYPEAIACFRRAITMDRSNYLLWYNLGITHRDSGDLERARDALVYARELEPEDEDVLDALGLLLMALGESENAIEVLHEGLELNPDNHHLWNNLGVVFFSQGAFSDASEAFEEALTIFPTYYNALYNLRDTYREMGNASGVAVCEERLREIPDAEKY
ncbi:MAG: tetratricopeptide repeat protein [Spirochaetaceae bacterium]|jgi:Flp pilus assembly protein TadD|nr:tetratricopeptide repeat protein [Spirochaetaceae bacterium]